MARDSNAHSVSISAALSVLATRASTLSAGQWGQVSVNAANQNTILGQGQTNGSMLPQTNQVFWCSQTKTIEIIGQDHQGGGAGSSGPGMRHAKYDEATNLFSTVEFQSALGGIGHGYDHSAINPFTGDLYRRGYDLGTGPLNVFRKPLSNRSVWLANVPASPTQWYQQVAMGSCWWSGSFTGGTGAGAQGCFMIFNSGASNVGGAATDGIIAAYDPLSNTWVYNQDGRAPFYGAGGTSTLHTIMEYSSVKNCAVYGGGNIAPRQLWKLSSNGTVTVMTQVPTGKSVGIGVTGSGVGRLVTDPVTGNFLLLSAGQLWELNPDGTGTWTQKTSPPAGVGNPETNGTWVAGVSLPDHGCVGFLRQDNASSGALWLYRNA